MITVNFNCFFFFFRKMSLIVGVITETAIREFFKQIKILLQYAFNIVLLDSCTKSFYNYSIHLQTFIKQWIYISHWNLNENCMKRLSLYFANFRSQNNRHKACCIQIIQFYFFYKSMGSNWRTWHNNTILK